MSNAHGSRSFSRSAFVGNLVVGFVGVLSAMLVPRLGAITACCIVAPAVIAISYGVTRLLRWQTQQGLLVVENAVITGEKPPGDSEFHRAADNLVSHVARLASVAAKGREQCREVEAVLVAFDRRSARGGKANPSHQLSMLLKSLGTDAQGIIDKISLVGADIEAVQQKIEEGSLQQGVLINKAAGEMDALAQSIDEVHSVTKQAKTKDSATTEAAESVSTQLIALQGQLEKLRDLIIGCEKKSQLLREQTVEIASLMQIIHDHASKSDTMALNASIESVRAGEHGRGFAAAADEIRKLTGIISDSASDVLERLNQVEGNVKDTHGICAEGHSTIDEQLGAAKELTHSMAEIRQATNQSRQHLDDVTQASDNQLQGIGEITEILEQLLEAADGTGLLIKEEQGVYEKLAEAVYRLAQVLSPLTGPRSITTTQPTLSPEAQPSEKHENQTSGLQPVGAIT